MHALRPLDSLPFAGRLNVTLELSIDGTALTINAGDIKKLAFELDLEGFAASASFWVLRDAVSQSDDLIEGFASRSLIETTMTIDRTFDEPGETMDPLVLKGIVVERRVMERAFEELDDVPVMRRLYEIRFVDPAAALWSNHHPAFVGVETTLKQIVEAQLPTQITISSEWEGYETSLPMCAYALGAASFYDWLRWWLDINDVLLRYDAAEQTYSIIDSKPTGDADEFPAPECGELYWVLPEPPRATPRILNTSTEAGTSISTGTNDDALSSLTRDILIRTPVESAGTDRLTLETSRLQGRDAELHGSFTQYPAISMTPGQLMSFESWSTETRYQASQWRILTLVLDAKAQDEDPSRNAGAEFNVYDMTYRFTLEASEDAAWRRRPYVAPTYPFQVEGTIVSEQGEEEEGTYQAYQDETTMLWVYQVYIPLFDVTVSAPYDAQAMPGHFYFPAYKDERVLLGLACTEASIVGFLDWRPGAKLSQDSQGNQLLLGKRDTDETSINHVYEDGNPAFRIERTHGQDRQYVTVEEGLIRFEAFEDEDDST